MQTQQKAKRLLRLLKNMSTVASAILQPKDLDLQFASWQESGFSKIAGLLHECLYGGCAYGERGEKTNQFIKDPRRSIRSDSARNVANIINMRMRSPLLRLRLHTPTGSLLR